MCGLGAIQGLDQWTGLRCIRPYRGLPQGYPLSPYLFIICGEALARTICNLTARSPAMFSSIAPKGDRIPLLQYADDTLTFIRANIKSAEAVKSILDRYREEAGQWLNLSKSSLTFSSNNPPREMNGVKRALGIFNVSPSFQYLGVSIGIERQASKPGLLILSRISRRINQWRGKTLSIAGRHTLLKCNSTLLVWFTITTKDTFKRSNESKNPFYGQASKRAEYTVRWIGPP